MSPRLREALIAAAVALIALLTVIVAELGGDTPPTSTTTVTSTTWTPPTLTTTTAPSTTVAPTTTTDGPAAIPPATNCRNHQPRLQRFDILLGAGGGEKWWNAQYCTDPLPYNGAYWVAGDRTGYRCAYMFLLSPDGTILGRAWFAVVRDQGPTWAGIGDDGMAEGVRYYDGSLAAEGDGRELGDCPAASVTYEVRDEVTDERPTILYGNPATVHEVRDYRTTTLLNVTTDQLRFTLHDVQGPFLDGRAPKSADHQVYGEATVVAWRRTADGWATGVVVYYTSMHPDVPITALLIP